jgi:hypothetical protein
VDVQNRRLRLWRIAELVVTVIAITLSVVAVKFQPAPNGRVVMTDIWVVLTVAWTFVWLERDARRPPPDATTEAYLRIATRRARQRRRVVWLALLLLLAQWTVLRLTHIGTSRTSIVFTGFWLAWAAWEWRSVRRQLRWLAQFESATSNDTESQK